MDKCPYQPSSESYSANEPKTSRSIWLDGPRGLHRPGIPASVIEVSVTWKLRRSDFQGLSAFYNAHIQSAGMFLIDLLIDSAAVQEHTACFIPGSFKIGSKVGNAYSATATLEVLQIQQTTSYYNQIVSFQDVPDAVYPALIHLVEVALPADL